MAEYGETFVLDMGEPVRIVDLVRGYAAQVQVNDYELLFTGLRPGEKLNETLLGSAESSTPTAHDRVRAVRTQAVPDDFGVRLSRLYRAAERNDVPETRGRLAEMIPEYRPSGVERIPVARRELEAMRAVEGEPL
jgi:FlaA1/EpsC-like NDP-sugar epimerase